MNKTKKTFIFAIFATLISLSIYFLLLFETYKTKGVIETYKKTISKKIIDNQELRNAKNLLRNTQDQREKLGTLFIGSEEGVSFIEYIESIGKFSGVIFSLDSVNIEPFFTNKDKEDDFFEKISMHVSVEGSWEEVYNFLSLIENIPYDIEIKKARIENIKEKENWTSVWKGSFEFLVFKIK